MCIRDRQRAVREGRSETEPRTPSRRRYRRSGQPRRPPPSSTVGFESQSAPLPGLEAGGVPGRRRHQPDAAGRRTPTASWRSERVPGRAKARRAGTGATAGHDPPRGGHSPGADRGRRQVGGALDASARSPERRGRARARRSATPRRARGASRGPPQHRRPAGSECARALEGWGLARAWAMEAPSRVMLHTIRLAYAS